MDLMLATKPAGRGNSVEQRETQLPAGRKVVTDFFFLRKQAAHGEDAQQGWSFESPDKSQPCLRIFWFRNADLKSNTQNAFFFSTRVVHLKILRVFRAVTGLEAQLYNVTQALRDINSNESKSLAKPPKRVSG